MHTYLISRPPGWKLWYTDLELRATEGKAAIGTAVKELQEAGYLRIERLTDDKNRVTGYKWIVAQSPDLMPAKGEPYTENQNTGTGPYTENQDTEKPYTGGPDTDGPYPGNPLYNKNHFVLSTTDSKNQTTPSDCPRATMPKEDITRLTEHFAATRGSRPVGKAWLPIQQGMRAMVVEEGYSVEQVIGCMDRLAILGWTWTMPTLRRWIADFAAGTMPSENRSLGNGASGSVRSARNDRLSDPDHLEELKAFGRKP